MTCQLRAICPSRPIQKRPLRSSSSLGLQSRLTGPGGCSAGHRRRTEFAARGNGRPHRHPSRCPQATFSCSRSSRVTLGVWVHLVGFTGAVYTYMVWLSMDYLLGKRRPAAGGVPGKCKNRAAGSILQRVLRWESPPTHGTGATGASGLSRRTLSQTWSQMGEPHPPHPPRRPTAENVLLWREQSESHPRVRALAAVPSLLDTHIRSEAV